MTDKNKEYPDEVIEIARNTICKTGIGNKAQRSFIIFSSLYPEADWNHKDSTAHATCNTCGKRFLFMDCNRPGSMGLEGGNCSGCSNILGLKPGPDKAMHCRGCLWGDGMRYCKSCRVSVDPGLIRYQNFLWELEKKK